MNRFFALALAAVALPVTVTAVGCGSSTTKTTSGAATNAPVTSAGTVSARSSPVGTILVDGSGRTLYMFEEDSGRASHCSGACASAWLPFATTASANAGAGVSAAKLTVINRPDGTRQVAYAGHPLYRFSGDTSAGSLSGQNQHAFGGDWHVLSPSGSQIDKDAPAARSSSDRDGSSGNGSGAYP